MMLFKRNCLRTMPFKRLPLGDKTDDETETPFTLDAETYDKMLNAYTEYGRAEGRVATLS